MGPLLALALATTPVGALVYVSLRRWPQRDLSAPAIPPHAVTAQVRRHPTLAAFVRSRLDPTSETGLLLTAMLAILAGSTTAFGVIAALLRADHGTAALDVVVATWSAQQATTASTTVLRWLTRLGGYECVAALSAVVALAEHRRRLGRSVVPLLLAVVGGQFALVNAVKVVVERARPDLAQLTGFAGDSFPSGHAAAGAASYAVYALLLGRRRTSRAKAVLGSFAVGIAVAVAGTRVLLGVHWFTDVLAGLFVGWAWFAVVSLAFGGRALRFGTAVATAAAAVSDVDASETADKAQTDRR